MSELERELFEKQLLTIAKRLEYPRTPNIAGLVMKRLRPVTRPRFRSRRLAWSLTIILILFSSLMLIPPARAAIIEFIQIGIVRIFPREVQPTLEPLRTATPESIVPMTATPSLPSATLIPSLRRIAGETTLAAAQRRVRYSILLPTYPPDLGPPDYVFVQDTHGVMTILVWLDPQDPKKVLMSLHFVPAGSWSIDKAEPKVIEETEVNGQRAIWTTGPYPIRVSNGDLQFTRLIDGNVLIWSEGNITYRLEINQSLEEAIKIAESLKPISTP
jgi:hypothetical protein